MKKYVDGVGLVDLTEDEIAARQAEISAPKEAHLVSTYRIVLRLAEAELINAADAELNKSPLLRAKFYTVGSIRADDPNALALLKAIGADASVIMAPE